MEEPGFRVLLTEPGDRKTEAVRAVRTVTGLSLWNSKLLLDRAPVAATEPDWLETAQDAADVLEAAGVRAAVLCGWCDRTVPREGAPSTRPRAPAHGPPEPAERATRPTPRLGTRPADAPTELKGTLHGTGHLTGEQRAPAAYRDASYASRMAAGIRPRSFTR